VAATGSRAMFGIRSASRPGRAAPGGEVEGEPGVLGPARHAAQGAAGAAGDVTGESEAQAVTAGLRAGFRSAVEAVEHALVLVGRDAGARRHDLEAHAVVRLGEDRPPRVGAQRAP